MGVDATSRTPQVVLDLPGFVVLAAGEYGGELKLLVETTTTVVFCHRCGGRAVAGRGLVVSDATGG